MSTPSFILANDALAPQAQRQALSLNCHHKLCWLTTRQLQLRRQQSTHCSARLLSLTLRTLAQQHKALTLSVSCSTAADKSRRFTESKSWHSLARHNRSKSDSLQLWLTRFQQSLALNCRHLATWLSKRSLQTWTQLPLDKLSSSFTLN